MKKITRFTGHRGTRIQRPENTKEAFDYVYKLRTAFNALGAEVSFEFDVRLTKDMVPVLIHDDHTRRTATGGSGFVSELTYEEMKALNFNKTHVHMTGTLITLEEMFELYPDAIFDAEIKETGERGIELAKIFITLINKYSAAKRMIMHIPCVQTSQFCVKNFPKGCQFELPGSLIQEFERETYLDQPSTFHEGYHQMCLHFRYLQDGKIAEYLSEKYIKKARDMGYPIITYWERQGVPLVNEHDLWKALSLGVDSVIVDDTLLALKTFADYVATN